MSALGWDELDVLLISGDAYVDSHSFGSSLLGRWLVAHGYKTGIVAQPDWRSTDDIARMGRPRLFAGVSAGSVDSLIAHYTAFRKKRGQDAYTPGGVVDKRPNRASIVYTGLVRQAFPGLPVALGGIEASLRRASHYDFWSDQLRRSILVDSKADVVLYGMGERSILELAALFSSAAARQRPAMALEQARLKGAVYAVRPENVPEDAEILPSHEAIDADHSLLIKATMAFERQMLQGGPCLVQRTASRVVVFEPPSAALTTREMDRVYSLPFTGRAHPSYTEAVPAVAMLEGSVTSHRGCGGGCSFCSLASHQGRAIQSRSRESILREVEELTKRPGWKGSITDIGGPTSNMWNTQCDGDRTACKRESCLYPKRCRHFKIHQDEQVDLLRDAAKVDGVKHVRVASGVRHDMALESDKYMDALTGEFTGGQLKIAPEHIAEKVLRLMRKPTRRTWETFIKAFARRSEEAGKEQYIIPYLMSAFPGCTDEDMEELAAWLKRRGWRPQQVQCFIPSPGTVATAMYFAGVDTDGRPIAVAHTDAQRLRQHHILVPEDAPPPGQRAGGGREGKKPFARRPREGGNFERKPRGESRGGSGFERRPRRDGEQGERSERPRRPFNRDENRTDRPPRFNRDGDKPPRPRREFDRGENSGERPQRFNRDENRTDRPPRKFENKRDGEFRKSGPKKPFERGKPGDKPFSGERRPPRKPDAPGGKRFGDRTGRPPRRDDKPGGFRKSGPKGGPRRDNRP